MPRKKKRKKKPKLVRVMTRLLKSDWAAGWIGLAVVLLGVLFFAVRLNAMFLFWAFALGAGIVIGSVVLVAKLRPQRVGTATGDDSDYVAPDESSCEPSSSVYYDDPFPDPPILGQSTNLRDHV